MKIEAELLRVINAAAKAQPKRTWRDMRDTMQAHIEAFIDARPSLKKKVKAFAKKEAQLEAQLDAIREAINDELGRFGLKARGEVVWANFDPHSNDPDEMKFINAGGTIPSPEMEVWKPESVIARLANADPSRKQSILAEYGINWS